MGVLFSTLSDESSSLTGEFLAVIMVTAGCIFSSIFERNYNYETICFAPRNPFGSPLIIFSLCNMHDYWMMFSLISREKADPNIL